MIMLGFSNRFHFIVFNHLVVLAHGNVPLERYMNVHFGQIQNLPIAGSCQ